MRERTKPINWPLAGMGLFALADLAYSFICVIRIWRMDRGAYSETQPELLAMAAVTAILYGVVYGCYLLYRSREKERITNPVLAALPFLWSLLLLCGGAAGNARTALCALFIAVFCILIFGCAAIARRNKECRREPKKKTVSFTPRELKKEKEALTADFINYDWKLEDAARRIQDREIAAAAGEMEQLVVSIYRERERCPEKAAVLQKFSLLYLPASVRLLNRYAELEQETARTKEQEELFFHIKSALFDVRSGLKSLWASMQEPGDLKLSAEMTVMENKLAGDGLLQEFHISSCRAKV